MSDPLIIKMEPLNYAPAPIGLHQAVICDVEYLGVQKTKYGENETLNLIFQLASINEATEKPFYVSRRYTRTLGPKSSLRRDLESLRGQKYSDHDLMTEGVDLHKLIGVNCQLQIAHEVVDDGRVFVKVQAIVPLGKDMPCLRVKDYVRKTNRQNNQEAREEDPPSVGF